MTKKFIQQPNTVDSFLIAVADYLGKTPQSMGFYCSVDPEPAEETTDEPAEDPISTTGTLSTDPGEGAGTKSEEDVSALKKALEAERARAKAAEKERKLHQKTIEQYQKYGNPDEVKSAMEAVRQQAELEEAARKKVSEAQANAEAKLRPIMEQAEENYRKEKELRLALEKRYAVEQWFSRPDVAGQSSEFDHFYTLAQDKFVYDPEKKEIVEVLDRQGKMLYAEGKPATPADLMNEIRKGTWGVSLSACFQPYQRSSGGGISPQDYRGMNRDQYDGMTATQKFGLAFGNSKRS